MRTIYLVFVTGCSGASFDRPDPLLRQGGGGIFRVISDPPSSGAHPHSFSGRGSVCYHVFLMGTHLVDGWGGAEWGQGQGMPKNTLRSWLLYRAEQGKGLVVHVFQSTVHPVTNSKYPCNKTWLLAYIM